MVCTLQLLVLALYLSDTMFRLLLFWNSLKGERKEVGLTTEEADPYGAGVCIVLQIGNIFKSVTQLLLQDSTSCMSEEDRVLCYEDQAAPFLS